MKYDKFIMVLKSIGINVVVNNNNVSFYAEDFNEPYIISYFDENTSKILEKKKINIEELKNIYIELIPGSNKYKSISMCLNGNNSEIKILNAYICDDGTEYMIDITEFENAINAYMYKLETNDKKKTLMSINIDGVFWVSRNNLDLFYNLNGNNTEVNYNKMKKIIDSCKYFNIFLEYYSFYNSEFMNIYNGFKLDSTYVRGLKL